MTDFTYTRGQLKLLAQCMELNPNLSDALFVFFDTAKLEPNCASTLNWLRHAERIQSEIGYIERLFCLNPPPNQIIVETIGKRAHDGVAIHC